VALEKPDFPVNEMKLVPRACDPQEPLKPGDTRYEDFADLRRQEGIDELKIELDQESEPGTYQHLPLCGHRGCGKSTEMLSLKKWADENGYLADHAEVDVHFGLIELEFSDMCLLAATRPPRRDCAPPAGGPG
jgi:hypothetical protein